MLLAAGKIQAIVDSDSVAGYSEITLYEASSNVRVNYMQYVSEHSTDVLLNLFIIFETAQVRIIPKDTILTSTQIRQFKVTYDLKDIERIIATVNVNEVVSYVITGELIDD